MMRGFHLFGKRWKKGRDGRHFSAGTTSTIRWTSKVSDASKLAIRSFKGMDREDDDWSKVAVVAPDDVVFNNEDVMSSYNTDGFPTMISFHHENNIEIYVVVPPNIQPGEELPPIEILSKNVVLHGVKCPYDARPGQRFVVSIPEKELSDNLPTDLIPSATHHKSIIPKVSKTCPFVEIVPPEERLAPQISIVLKQVNKRAYLVDYGACDIDTINRECYMSTRSLPGIISLKNDSFSSDEVSNENKNTLWVIVPTTKHLYQDDDGQKSNFQITYESKRYTLQYPPNVKPGEVMKVTLPVKIATCAASKDNDSFVSVGNSNTDGSPPQDDAVPVEAFQVPGDGSGGHHRRARYPPQIGSGNLVEKVLQDDDVFTKNVSSFPSLAPSKTARGPNMDTHQLYVFVVPPDVVEPYLPVPCLAGGLHVLVPIPPDALVGKKRCVEFWIPKALVLPPTTSSQQGKKPSATTTTHNPWWVFKRTNIATIIRTKEGIYKPKNNKKPFSEDKLVRFYNVAENRMQWSRTSGLSATSMKLQSGVDMDVRTCHYIRQFKGRSGWKAFQPNQEGHDETAMDVEVSLVPADQALTDSSKTLKLYHENLQQGHTKRKTNDDNEEEDGSNNKLLEIDNMELLRGGVVKTLEDQEVWFRQQCLKLTNAASAIDVTKGSIETNNMDNANSKHVSTYTPAYVRIQIRPEHLLSDSKHAILHLTPWQLRQEWQLELIESDKEGHGSQPRDSTILIDAGGIFQEWLELVTTQLFDKDLGLWESNPYDPNYLQIVEDTPGKLEGKLCHAERRCYTKRNSMLLTLSLSLPLLYFRNHHRNIGIL